MLVNVGCNNHALFELLFQSLNLRSRKLKETDEAVRGWLVRQKQIALSSDSVAEAHQRIVARELLAPDASAGGLVKELDHRILKDGTCKDFGVPLGVRTKSDPPHDYLDGDHLADMRDERRWAVAADVRNRRTFPPQILEDVARRASRQLCLAAHDVMLGTIASGYIVLGRDQADVRTLPQRSDDFGFPFDHVLLLQKQVNGTESRNWL